jgi:hypothetical protein
MDKPIGQGFPLTLGSPFDLHLLDVVRRLAVVDHHEGPDEATEEQPRDARLSP